MTVSRTANCLTAVQAQNRNSQMENTLMNSNPGARAVLWTTQWDFSTTKMEAITQLPHCSKSGFYGRQDRSIFSRKSITLSHNLHNKCAQESEILCSLPGSVVIRWDWHWKGHLLGKCPTRCVSPGIRSEDGDRSRLSTLAQADKMETNLKGWKWNK
jgi:hypothetical protein